MAPIQYLLFLLFIGTVNYASGMESFLSHKPRIVQCEIGQRNIKEAQTAGTAMALCAIAHLTQCVPNEITPEDLFNVIKAGAHFYSYIGATNFLACDLSLIESFNALKEESFSFLEPLNIGIDGSPFYHGENSRKGLHEKNAFTTEDLISYMQTKSYELNQPVCALWTIDSHSYAIIIHKALCLFFNSHHKYYTVRDSSGSYAFIFDHARSLIQLLLSMHPGKLFAATLLRPTRKLTEIEIG